MVTVGNTQSQRVGPKCGNWSPSVAKYSFIEFLLEVFWEYLLRIGVPRENQQQIIHTPWAHFHDLESGEKRKWLTWVTRARILAMFLPISPALVLRSYPTPLYGLGRIED